MAQHPYAQAAPYRRWRRAVAETPPHLVDPVVAAKFRIARGDRVVTAGSCFAQHIAQHLRTSGFDFLVTESAHPLLPPEIAEQFGYGIYSARTGNIYTSRQLLQLLRRAYGRLTPKDDVWEQSGVYYDPYRPAIQPCGFATKQEYDQDRAQHFAAVRHAFETMDVLVFTLGLTECWEQEDDGCVYPICPGTIAGTFDAARHVLRTLSVDDVVSDMQLFFDEVRSVNPGVKMVLTVSPVPLAATALDRHVLVSTIYSKSVLRVAAEILSRHPDVLYFPSYEIVTGPHAGGRYFAEDRRSVTKDGVDHVMRLFLDHVTAQTGCAQFLADEPDHFAIFGKAVAVLCEEEALDPP
jgi:hypothetical protein